MNSNRYLNVILTIIAILLLLNLFGGHDNKNLNPFKIHSSAYAQEQLQTEGIILYAGPRRDTMKDESFIFYNPTTGDLWVYRNDDLKERYRVSKLGEKLEKIKD